MARWPKAVPTERLAHDPAIAAQLIPHRAAPVAQLMLHRAAPVAQLMLHRAAPATRLIAHGPAEVFGVAAQYDIGEIAQAVEQQSGRGKTGMVLVAIL